MPEWEAAVGVGIDALITRRRIIYERPLQSATFSVSPILSEGRRGMMVSVKY
jgi:hypothetical protein